MPTLTAAEIARLVGGGLRGDGSTRVSGVSTPDAATSDDLIFVDATQRAAMLETTRASVALVPPGVETTPRMVLIDVARPALAMAIAVEALVPAVRTWHGISERASVASTATVGEGVGVGPFAVIADHANIGNRTEIHAGATVGARARIGADCVLHAGVHVYHDVEIGDRVVLHSGSVIGADGFGYLTEPTGDPDEPVRHRKIRQVGRVVIEDDVEIGANATIDRAALSETRVGRGTKIDNLVTVGHNTTIGRHAILIGQSGIAGSTTLEDYVTVAGQAGVAGHVTIGHGATIGAQAGVTKNVPPGTVVLGSPAIEERRAKLALSLLARLPDMKRLLGDHARRLLALERRLGHRPDEKDEVS
jgi:UDP-3-O-[3-hydroxymyristoyl] glucosamine N-acyltransferase